MCFHSVFDCRTDRDRVNIIVYWGYVCPLYGLSLFLPTIIKELGYKTTTAQLLTVPIYITASIICVGVAYIADRKRIRFPFILGGLIFQLIGFIMCISSGNAGVTYAGVFIIGEFIRSCDAESRRDESNTKADWVQVALSTNATRPTLHG